MDWTSLVWYHYLSILLPSLYSLQFVLLSFLRLRHLGYRQPLPGEFLQQLLQDLQPQIVRVRKHGATEIYFVINLKSFQLICRVSESYAEN